MPKSPTSTVTPLPPASPVAPEDRLAATRTLDVTALGRILAASRDAAGLTQVEAAQRLGVEPSTVCRLELGQVARPAFDIVATLASVYAVSLDVFDTLKTS